MSEYIRGALASEMPPTFHEQALAAQAVAAHSYALYCARMQSEHPDPSLKGAVLSVDFAKAEGFLDQERFNKIHGSEAALYWPKICQAADFGYRHVLTYDGEPVLAAYHAMSTGMTESAGNVWTASVPYLIPVESDGDSLSTNYVSETTFSRDELKEKLLRAFPDAVFNDDDPLSWLDPIEYSQSGYITLILVGGVEAHGTQVRAALGLRSSCFGVDFSGDTFTIETTGYGHGVGMSQSGADFMARQGSDCAQILSHYYPGTEMVSIL
jgi:stage II sporulation protein D